MWYVCGQGVRDPCCQRQMEQFEEWRCGLSQKEVLSLKFYDEVGIDRRNLYPTHGRAKRGTRPTLFVDFRDWRQHYTSGCLMSLDGMPPVWDIKRGGFSGDDVVNFFTEIGLPSCHPGDTIVMDNVTTHHHEWGAKLATYASLYDVKIKYLPKYCPELNPIESLFGKMKAMLRNVPDKNIFRGLQEAYESVSHENCLAWATDCGYRYY
mmetsp:Transcript_538/g.991  ORF Transcript_538/g.991 Transcript_538/m.991 type:complete len:208 (-) Transcript_538:27-650(-)